jgi:hypothetical protein
VLSGSPSRDGHLLTVWQPCCSYGDGPNIFRPSNHPEQTNKINNKLRVTAVILRNLIRNLCTKEMIRCMFLCSYKKFLSSIQMHVLSHNMLNGFRLSLEQKVHAMKILAINWFKVNILIV